MKKLLLLLTIVLSLFTVVYATDMVTTSAPLTTTSAPDASENETATPPIGDTNEALPADGENTEDQTDVTTLPGENDTTGVDTSVNSHATTDTADEVQEAPQSRSTVVGAIIAIVIVVGVIGLAALLQKK